MGKGLTNGKECYIIRRERIRKTSRLGLDSRLGSWEKGSRQHSSSERKVTGERSDETTRKGASSECTGLLGIQGRGTRSSGMWVPERPHKE